MTETPERTTGHTGERTGRRAFAANMAAAVIGLATAPRRLLAEAIKRDWTSDEGIRQSAGAPGSSTAIPFPSYLPAGYRHHATYTGRPDGFGGGNKEVAHWFKTPRFAQGFNHPLAIFLTTEVKHPFYLTEERVAEPLRFWMTETRAIDAAYHDGMWVFAEAGERVHSSGARLHWQTDNVHSLVFRLNDFTVGIRASKRTGVTLHELVRVARSLR